MPEFNLQEKTIRDLNQSLHTPDSNQLNETWTVNNTEGKHSVAVGVDAPLDVQIHGHVGYYCAGMNKEANITVNGNAGAGLAENIISGTVRVKGNASQYAAATGHGGLVVIEGDASSRCGISMKGVDIVVGGSVGHMSAFMGQSGNLVICGDAGDALGDSIYEVNIFVQGNVKSLGADCVEKEMTDEIKVNLQGLLDKADIKADASNFKYFSSGRQLYNFKVDDAYLP